MEFCSLFSGSSGNSLFVRAGATRLLIDAGKNGRQVECALTAIGEDAAALSGIVITHEHSDHIAAAGVLSRRYDLPVYANFETWLRLHGKKGIGKIAPHNERVFEMRRPFALGDAQLTPFYTSHDAACAAGFVLTDGCCRIGVATDTGIITQDMRTYLPGCSLVALEFNHDFGMLQTGPYPYPLKRRIQGAGGHLSNEDAAAFAAELVENGTEEIVLAHLSHQNNLPMLAHQTAARVLAGRGITAEDVHLEVAGRDVPGTRHFR